MYKHANAKGTLDIAPSKTVNVKEFPISRPVGDALDALVLDLMEDDDEESHEEESDYEDVKDDAASIAGSDEEDVEDEDEDD